MSIRDKFICLDCPMDTGKEHEYYYVNSELWAKTGIGSQDGMLCIGCLENRIGRKLLPEDFTDAYVNNIKFTPMSQRLYERRYGHT
jgi:hypothetical protein